MKLLNNDSCSNMFELLNELKDLVFVKVKKIRQEQRPRLCVIRMSATEASENSF